MGGPGAVLELLKQTGVEWWQDETFRFAASLAFYTIFSLAPLVLLSTGIASLFFIPSVANENIVLRIQELVGQEAARTVKQIIDASTGFGRNVGAIVLGAVTFFLGASVVFGELQAALNKIWDVQPNACRGAILKLVIDRLRSFGIALAVGFLLAISLILTVVIHNLQTYSAPLTSGTPWMWQGINVIVSFAVEVTLFAIIYKYLPDVQLAWNDVWTGAAVTGLLFTAGKYGIGLYLGHASVGSAFGAAGSLAAFLVWVYYSAVICFFGAEFTQVYARYRGRMIQPSSHAIAAGRKHPNRAGNAS